MRIFDLFKRRELDCQEVREASSGFIDGEVGYRMRARIASHLKRCEHCKAFISTLRATVNLLRSAPTPELPVGFKQRIRDSLKS